MQQQGFNLDSAPLRISEIHGQLLPLSEELSQLDEALKNDNTRFAEYLVDDPTKDQPHGFTPGLQKIRDWVAGREELKLELEQLEVERQERRTRLTHILEPLNEELSSLDIVVAEREKRLEEALAVRERDNLFTQKLSDPGVYSAFIQYHSQLLLNSLDANEIPLSGCDAADRAVYQSWQESKSRHRWEPMFGSSAGRLASIKTLSAVYAQLALETSYRPRKSFVEGFSRALKTANIQKVLEIGTGKRGMLHLLAETGIAKQCNLELFAFDPNLPAECEETFRDLGITLFRTDANKAVRYLGKSSMDLVLGAGVLSLGGLAPDLGELDIFKQYQAVVKKAHSILKTLTRLLSRNPHALMVHASVHGVLSVQREQIKQLDIQYWQKNVRNAFVIESHRVQDYSPIRSGQSDHTTAQGKAWMKWAKANEVGLDYTRKLIDQSADLAVLKRL